MLDGIMKVAGSFIPDEKKADAVYNAIDKILNFQAAKFNVPIEKISANITKSKGFLEVDIWKVETPDDLEWLGSVERDELIKILGNE